MNDVEKFGIEFKIKLNFAQLEICPICKIPKNDYQFYDEYIKHQECGKKYLYRALNLLNFE